MYYAVIKRDQDKFLADVLDLVKNREIVIGLLLNKKRNIKHFLISCQLIFGENQYHKAERHIHKLLNEDCHLLIQGYERLWQTIDNELIFLDIYKKLDLAQNFLQNDPQFLTYSQGLRQLIQLNLTGVPEFNELNRKYLAKLTDFELKMSEYLEPDLKNLMIYFANTGDTELIKLLPPNIRATFARSFTQKLL